MDKLQPLITHKFWVMCGLALLLPLIGWFMGTGDLAANIDSRTTELDSKFTGVPQGTSNPNKDWIDKVSKVNEVEEALLKQAGEDLLRQQVDLRTWPPSVEPDMVSVAFRGEIGPRARETFRSAYYPYLEDVLQIVEPFDVTTGKGKVLMPGLDSANSGAATGSESGGRSGMLSAAMSSGGGFSGSSFQGDSTGGSMGQPATGIPHVPGATWSIYAPTSEVMWDAQEDVWLLRDLLESIRDVNSSANAIGEAAVRQVVGITFQGGTRDDGSAPAPGGEDGEDDEDYEGNSSGQGTGGLAGVSVDFNLADEVGSPGSLSAYGGDDEDDDSSSDSSSSEYPGYAGAAGTALKRYVDEDPELPFKTRAFKMTVIMDHRRLPEFLDELTNSSWPVTILRVHQQQLFSDPSSGVGASFGGRGGEEYDEDSSGFSGSTSSFQPSGFGGAGGRSGMQLGSQFGSSFDEESDGGLGFGGDILNGIGQGVFDRNYSHVAASAMQDRYLAQVVIGGLMTLYQSPQEADGADTESESAESQESVEPAENAKEPTDGTAAESPAQPATTEDGQPISPNSDKTDPAVGTANSDTPAEPPSTTPKTDEKTSGESPAPANETSSNPKETDPALPKN